jgi:hypothetical protein
MNRYLLLLVALLVMVVGVQGLALDFQNPTDFSAQAACVYTHSCGWSYNTTGGNSYISMAQQYNLGSAYVLSQTALPMTYAAATSVINPSCGELTVYLFDGSYVSLGSATATGVITGSRVEMKMIGGDAHIFVDGVDNITISSVSPNPSYVAWGTTGSAYGGNCGLIKSDAVDDIVWGSTESRYIFGMPENGYFLQKDILNPAASGFYRVNQTDPNGSPTLINSNTFTSTFGKNSGTNETVTLHSPSGGMGLSYDTGTAYAGTIYWNLTQFFSQSTTGYGLYQTDINPQTDSPGFATSDWIPYIGTGANIQFDKNSYAVGETATLTVTISDAYYDVVTSPHVVIQDIFGTEVQDDTTIVFTQQMSGDWTGTSTYTWQTGDDEGVYFGLIYATYSGDEVLMNYDTADLSSNLIVNGYVKDAETTNVISGASVNVTQGSTTDALTSAADGNYTTTSAFSATATSIVASATGYETYQTAFTPLAAGSIEINITLMPTSPTFTGIALGGIARTPPFNRTIDSATITISNTSTGTLTATTNSAGYYIRNNMPNNYIWNIVGSKSGFANSTIYQKLVVGI